MLPPATLSGAGLLLRGVDRRLPIPLLASSLLHEAEVEAFLAPPYYSSAVRLVLVIGCCSGSAVPSLGASALSTLSLMVTENQMSGGVSAASTIAPLKDSSP